MSDSAFGGPRPLAADVDRERLVALLREHYALGQFDLEELSRRVGVALSAHYMDEAAAAMADLPQLADPGAIAPHPTKRRRGHAQVAKPAAGWMPTNERFRDPTTGEVIRIWIDPIDQSRHYVPESSAG